MSSDDDDDEPLFSSPDPASDQEDDVFKCKARRFVRLDDNAKTTTSATPTPSKPRASAQSSSKRQLTATQRAQEKRNIQRQEWLAAADSDSDAENVVTTLEDSPFHLAQQEKQKVNLATKRRLQYENQPYAKKQTIVDLLDSDSEDEVGTTDYVPLAFVNGWNKDAVDVLLQSQLATAKLQMAQQYHAEDVIVPVQSPISTKKPPTSTASTTKPATTPARPANLGQKLRLGCRTQMEINGRKEKPTTQMYALHEYEPLSILSNKLCQVLSVPNTARMTWTFDGMTLDLKRSPHSYEMEDEDLIDISIKMLVVKDVSANATATTTSTPNANRGPILALQLRIQAGKLSKISPVQLGANETFLRLEELYKKQQKLRPSTVKLIFRFDGFVLDKAKRPVDYDMESEDLIDVTVNK